MIWLEVILLAVVQGIGEFLPISSSGHVIVGLALFEWLKVPIDEKLAVNVVLHLGTLGAILAFYWRRIWALLGEDRRVILLLLIGTLPAVALGLPAKQYCQRVLESPLTAGLCFPITGALLLFSARREPGGLLMRKLSPAQALLIGLFQAVAVLPGISRSGATIVAGLGAGLKRDEAAAFAFLLAIPAIAGAGVIELADLVGDPSMSVPPITLLLGATVSFFVGLAALWWLVRWLVSGRLHLFAWWVIPLGIAVLLWQWLVV